MFLIFQVTICEEKQTFVVNIYTSFFEKWGHLSHSKEYRQKEVKRLLILNNRTF
jgi:hypothetical protein